MLNSKTIIKALPNILQTVSVPHLGKKYKGKVRDFYIQENNRILITTDRQSAFDVILGCIPYKGAVLNLLAAFWFEKTKHIIENHVIEIPDDNITIAKNCVPIPVEMVVRGYISGVTNTSIWGSYKKGEREIYGIRFKDGLVKNQMLPNPIITPTTHGGGKNGHDQRLTRDEIIKLKIVPKNTYEEMEEVALKLFDFGSKWCKKKGLILVDTKYEFGLYNGKLVVIDEIHTPDSSRFWLAKTYKERFTKGIEPENYDKEFLRLWYKEKGYDGNGKPPKMSTQLQIELAKRYINIYEKITGKKFHSFDYPIEARIINNLSNLVKAKITYAKVGDNYETKDPIKIHTQNMAAKTGKNLLQHSFSEIENSRGESAYVWKRNNEYFASVIEGLGTKNLVADGTRDGEVTYYDVIGHDTVATVVNDLITVGARPLVVHAYWAIQNNTWLYDKKRMNDLILGWKTACDLAAASWGGGETATMKGILKSNTVELGGSAMGYIQKKDQLIEDSKLENGDRILLLSSNGINANGISLARAIAKKLPKGYRTIVSENKTYGQLILTKTNIYVRLIADLLDNKVNIHYISNITGHGLRKIMRAKGDFSYIIEDIFDPQEVFSFIKKQSGLSEKEMYGTFNMGMDFAIFIPKNDVKKTIKMIQKHNFSVIEAGYIEKGERKVVIVPKNITYQSEALALR